jgi:hypothetical protein
MQNTISRGERGDTMLADGVMEETEVLKKQKREKKKKRKKKEKKPQRPPANQCPLPG